MSFGTVAVAPHFYWEGQKVFLVNGHLIGESSICSLVTRYDSQHFLHFHTANLNPASCFFSPPRNPTPGIVINRPNGSDVYHGVPKDYTKDVCDQWGGGRVLQQCEQNGLFAFLTVLGFLTPAGSDPTELPGCAEGR